MSNISRREIRDSAMKLLFETSMRDDPIDTLYEIAEEIDEITVNDAVRTLVDGTLAHLDELDELLDPDEQYLDMLKILDSLSQIFMLMSVAALGLAFVVLYNMGMLNYMERYREYATLKVLGYHQQEIRGLISAENNLITLAGLALGVWPGRQLTELVLQSCESDTMAFASTVNLPSYLIAIVVTYLFSWMITRLLSSKVKNVDMVEALKSVE